MRPPRTVLVTGATGFVGSHLLDALVGRPERSLAGGRGPGRGPDAAPDREGIRVRALVRASSRTDRLEASGVEVVQGALAPDGALAAAVAGADVVVHLAAATRARRPAEFEVANAAGTRALVDAIVRAEPRPRRLVYLSSLAAVGPATDPPVDAGTAPRPLTAYGRSKLAGEAACLEAAGEVEVVVVRAPAVYGPRDRDMYTFFRFAAWGMVPVPGGLEHPVQLIHAADLGSALARAMTAPGAAGVYHAAERRAYTWREVAELMGRAVGRSARPVAVPAWSVRLAAACSEWGSGLLGRAAIFDREKARELLAPGWTCETERALRDLGWQAEIALADGLAATAAWYRAEGWL